jgi:hypothetical protein
MFFFNFCAVYYCKDPTNNASNVRRKEIISQKFYSSRLMKSFFIPLYKKKVNIFSSTRLASSVSLLRITLFCWLYKIIQVKCSLKWKNGLEHAQQLRKFYSFNFSGMAK